MTLEPVKVNLMRYNHRHVLLGNNKTVYIL